MPPPNIVRDVRALIQTTLTPVVPRRWRKQFDFGMQAFSLRPFQSAGSNARQVVAKPATASTKCDRLLGNSRLAARFGNVFDQLGLVRRGSYVNIDHSDQDGLTSLVGAVQTRHGRAVPCLVETTYAHQIPNDSPKPRWQKLRAAMLEAREVQSFTGHTIDTLQNFRDRLDFWPKLVFDRGFGNESILTHLHAEGATFYVRLKAGRYVECDGERTTVRELPQRDGLVTLFGLALRVVRTPESRTPSGTLVYPDERPDRQPDKGCPDLLPPL